MSDVIPSHVLLDQASKAQSSLSKTYLCVLGAEGRAVSTEEAAIPLAHSRRIQRHAGVLAMLLNIKGQQQRHRKIGQRDQRKSAARLARANVGRRSEASRAEICKSGCEVYHCDCGQTTGMASPKVQTRA